MNDKNGGLTRRQFITRSVGLTGLMAATTFPLLHVLNTTEASDGVSEGTGEDRKIRAWCMVVDLKKCDGCVGLGIPPQCLQTCIVGHFIPKGQQWIEVYEVDLPGGGSYFMPTPCFQCENAPCVNVCPVAATYHDRDGVVLIDHNRCIGCRMCMAACPYHRRFFNWGTPELPPEAIFAEYSPEHPVPAIQGTVIKCDFCPHILRQGKLPFCVTGCPRKVLYIGDLNEDVASNGEEVVVLSEFLSENDAYRYKEELGTQPRVWYLPGHGQDSGRRADDSRPLQDPEWLWGGDGYNRSVDILWPLEGKDSK